MRRNTYPTALPLRSSDELDAQARELRRLQDDLSALAARLRRWTVRLIIAATVVALVSAGAVAYALNGAPAGRIAPVADPEAPQDSVLKSVQPAGAQADLLEALGSLSVAHLYQSHLNIGLLADGVESKTSTIAEAEESLKPVLDLMAQVDASLAKIAKSELDAEDRRAVQQIQAVSALLRLQADALRAYWANGEMPQASDFQEARKASWQGLAKVMGSERQN
jgi:hypothetical protein